MRAQMLACAPRRFERDVPSDGVMRWCEKRRRTQAATAAVLGNTDLVAHILRDNIGASTLAAASLVSRVWLEACRSDPSVLRGAALYQGGLTKAQLKHLFAIADSTADALPCTRHARRGGGLYCLYEAAAVDTLLGPDGMAEWRLRLRARAASRWSCLLTPPPHLPRRARWQEEERLHNIATLKRARIEE